MKTILVITLIFGLASLACGAGYRVNTPNTNWDYSYPYQKTKLGNNNWFYGSATYYDWMGNSGACGMPWFVVNKVDTAAVPLPRYQDFNTPGVPDFEGAACGQCFWVKCIEVPRYANMVYCKQKKSVLVHIVDFDVPGTWNAGTWPNNHFDLKPATFEKLAHKGAGIINVKFKRARCRSRLARWSLGANSNPFWKDLSLWFVPSVGSHIQVWAKPTNRNKWYQGKRLWGSHYSFLGGFVFDSKTKVVVVLAEKKGTVPAAYTQKE